MDFVCDRKKCTGCSACVNICKHKAIIMKADLCGFLHPIVDHAKCIGCELCRKVCPVNSSLPLSAIKTCYAAITSDEKELFSCSSGGAATVISRCIINNGGVVYGCSGNDVSHFRHVRVDNIDGLEQLKGSKYVQSDMGDIMNHIHKDLKDGLPVLFVGTPCQVAGVRNFLGREYNNLYTADLVCHGVPNQKMFNENLKRYTDTPNDANVFFRRKENGKGKYKIEFGLGYKSKKTGKSVFKPYNRDYYMFGFLRCLTFRENCYTCPFACKDRVGDITLCDFWGLDDSANFEKSKGVSAILINTNKGKNLFDISKGDLVFKERSVEEATRWNCQLNYPSVMSSHYSFFLRECENKKFIEAMRSAYYKEFIYDSLQNMKNFIRRVVFVHILRNK